MAFHEELFPLRIALGAAVETYYSTAIHETDSPHEERIGRWTQARRRYDAGLGVQTKEQAEEVYRFFLARRGTEIGFRFRDYLDWSTGLWGTEDPTPTDVVIGTGDDSTTTFQLVKKYSDGTVTRTRTITKPIAGTVRVAIDGVEQTSGWTVDTTTGIVTITSAPVTDEEITAGFRFDVPGRFAQELGDGLRLLLSSRRLRTVPSIPIIELLDEEPVQGEFFFGGSGAGVVLAASPRLAPACPDAPPATRTASPGLSTAPPQTIFSSYTSSL